MDVDQIDLAPAIASVCDNAIAESRERYASLFAYHPHAAYSVDRHGYFTDANPPALEMTGLSLQQMREAHFSQVIHPADLHLVEDAFTGAMTGEPQLVEARVLRADGAIIDVRCTAIPVVVGGQVVGVHGITEDVTDARRVRRQLEEANAARTLFLATVSREVRTPLAVLVGAADLLMGSELGPEPAHYADLVHRSGQRLSDLVDDMSEFSGLDARETVLRPAPFQVRTVVADIAEWAAPQAEGRSLAISFDVEDSVPTTLVGDARRVAQVVSHLVQNAITFTEHGAVDVRVGTRVGPPTPGGRASTWVEFLVSDTGVGIAKDDVQGVFELFVRADLHSHGDHQGAGLGLAICRLLVDLMEGELQADSATGEGSTFTFVVPLETVQG